MVRRWAGRTGKLPPADKVRQVSDPIFTNTAVFRRSRSSCRAHQVGVCKPRGSPWILWGWHDRTLAWLSLAWTASCGQWVLLATFSHM